MDNNKGKTFVRSTHGGFEFFLPARYKPVDLIGNKKPIY